jgi:hypothetical protein
MVDRKRRRHRTERLFSEVTKRPFLSASLTPQDFASWYWLKEELVVFCREHQISPSGSKLQLQSRITDYLSRKNPVKRPTPQRSKTQMPTTFTMDTIIGEGWRCNPSLGAFFKQNLGLGFHFNAATRDFIHHQPGKTLADAAICYQTSVRPVKKKPPIPQQLEYNQHFRDFFRDNPGSSRQQAIDAWWIKRGKRKERADPPLDRR